MQLTATETQRIKNFTADMDVDTEQAMFALFEITKPGFTRFANRLFVSAFTGETLPPEVIATFSQHGLVYTNGVMPKKVKAAIRKAIKESYLKIHDPNDPVLRPDDTESLTYH